MSCSFSAVSMWVGVPLAPLAEPEPYLQTASGALTVDIWDLKNKGKNPNNDKNHANNDKNHPNNDKNHKHFPAACPSPSPHVESP